MSKVKLYSTNETTKGKPVTLPILGDIVFDIVDNSVEIESDQVDALLNLDFGIKLVLNIDKKEGKEKTSNFEMLKALNETEIDQLLINYPKSQVKKLNSLDKKIEYLNKRM